MDTEYPNQQPYICLKCHRRCGFHEVDPIHENPMQWEAGLHVLKSDCCNYETMAVNTFTNEYGNYYNSWPSWVKKWMFNTEEARKTK